MSSPFLSFFVNNPRTLRSCGVLALLVLLAASIAAAQAGQLDATFANNGIFSSSFNGGFNTNLATVVALQSDGKIVVGGQINTTGGIIRLNSNGTLDKTFGTSGLVSIKFRDGQDVTTGLAIQSDGKIVVAGTGLPAGGQLDRLNSDGSFDHSFGSNGVVALDNTPGQLALQSDGKILVVGAIQGTGNRIAERFLTTGQMDTTFGNGGTASLVSEGSITLQSDGKILIGSVGLLPLAGLVTRYSTSGNLDNHFGIFGQAAGFANPAAVAEQSNFYIVAAGTGTNKLLVSGNISGFGLERFHPNGMIDTTFGTRGGVVTNFPNASNSSANAMLIQPNGDIVAAGQAGNNTNQLTESFALARYLSTGQLDTTFGSGGLVTTSFGNNAVAFINAIALQTDGKIVAVGTNNSGTFIVARYLGQ